MEYYKILLIEKLKWASNQKFIIYNQGCLNRKGREEKTYHYQWECFHFFEEWNLYYNECNKKNMTDKCYIPEQKFNYYLLIRENFYKTFKNLNLHVQNHFICINDEENSFDTYFTLFPDVTKFIQGTYNKKRICYNGINYIRLKLRAFKNTFIPNFCLSFDRAPFIGKKIIEKNEHCITSQIKFLSGCKDENNNVKLMAIPVKKKYTNIINLSEPKQRNMINELKLSRKLILKFPYSVDIIENILDEYKDKKYYDPKIYHEDWFSCELLNEETDNIIYFNFIYIYKYDENDDY